MAVTVDDRLDQDISVIADDLVTVVIPARNEEHFIGRCLASICAQTYENMQIVVVDGSSTDRTVKIVERLAFVDPRIEVVANPDQIIPVGLNRAVEAARGRWLVRVDAHSTVPPDYVATAVSHLQSGRWGGVGGRKDGIGRTPAGRAIAVAMGSRFGVGNSTYHHGQTPQTVEHIPFGCYPIELIRQLGGWDEALRVNQDFEFDHRVRAAGHELLFDPELRIDWHCRQAIADLTRQYARYGRGKVRVFRKHPDSIRPRQVAPIVLLPALLLGLLLVRRQPRLAAILLGPYATFLLAGTVDAHGELDTVADKCRLPAAFAAMHLGFSKGLWVGVAENLREMARSDDPSLTG